MDHDLKCWKSMTRVLGFVRFDLNVASVFIELSVLSRIQKHKMTGVI